MKVLALDSTALVASVALCEDGKLLGELTLNNGNTHSQTLLPMVEFLLKQFDMTPGDVDLFAATVGPGSFTGVRIGAATLKGLAFGTNKPCAAVSTLEALAYNLKDFDGLICPVILPIVAKKLGFDPTVMAGPFITTLVDAISLFVYFSIATNMLGL